MPFKVLSTFGINEKRKGQVLDILQPVGGTLVIAPNNPPERDTFIQEQIADTEILYAGALSEAQFAAARNLKWIQVPFAGVNNLLATKAIIDSDVVVTNSAGVMAPPLADQIMGYVLSFSRALPQQWKAQQEQHWASSQEFGLIELAGQTLGIIGYGKIGNEVARRAKAFGMRVVATKHNTAGHYPEVDQLWPDNGLDELLAQSDYVVVAAPLTPETNGLIGRAQLEKMKPSAYLINIARGQLVREQELIGVLQDKKIAGAALDVFEKEPLPDDSPLWKLDNVIITPHSSGVFDGFMKRSVALFCDNLRHYLAHEPLINLVDKKRGY